MIDFPVPDRMAKAFAGRTSLTLVEAADALEMDARSFKTVVDQGKVKFLLRGGTERRRLRRFLLVDLLAYLDAERKQACPSTRGPTRRSSGPNSPSKVSDFASLRAKRIADGHL